MKTIDSLPEMLERLAELRGQCPDMRWGQLLATIGMLAQDETGHSLWDVEDADFAAAVRRFAADLARRGPNAA
jgi:hypothetical protein